MRTTLRLPSGFGEIAIAWMKLSRLPTLLPGLTFDAELCRDHPRGCEEFVSLLDSVSSVRLGTHTTTDVLANTLPWDAFPDDLPGRTVYPTVDAFLVGGRHIISWLPDVAPDYHYSVNLPRLSRDFATLVAGEGPYGVVYPSSLARQHLIGGWGSVWTPDDWADLVRQLHRRTDLPWYVIGDTVHDGSMLAYLVSSGAVPAERALRTATLCDALALIDRAAYFVGFPAGPAVVAGVLDVPHCVPFRWPVQRFHRGSFTDPARILDGRAYLPWFTDSPGAVAGEVAARLRVFTRSTTGAGGARYLPDFVVDGKALLSRSAPAEPDLPDRLTEAGRQFRLKAMGLLAHPDCGEDHYRLLYALGRHYQPRQLLVLGAGRGHGACSVLTGVLDAGVPPVAVALVGPGQLDYTLSVVRRVCERSSHRPDVRAAVPGTRDLLGASNYEMVLVEPSGDCLAELRWAFRRLTAPGTLVVTGVSNHAVRNAYRGFCGELGVECSEYLICCGVGLVRCLPR